MVLNSLRFRAYGLGLSGLVRRSLNEAYARDCIPDTEWEKNPPQLFQEPPNSQVQGYPPPVIFRMHICKKTTVYW